MRLDGLVGPLDRVEAARPLAPLLRRPRVEVMRPLVRMIFEHEAAPRLARGRCVEGARTAQNRERVRGGLAPPREGARRRGLRPHEGRSSALWERNLPSMRPQRNSAVAGCLQ